MTNKMILVVLLPTVVSCLKLLTLEGLKIDNTTHRNPNGGFSKASNDEEVDCRDSHNYKCWQKGGHLKGPPVLTLMWSLTEKSTPDCYMDSQGCISPIPDFGSSADNYKPNAACTINVGSNPRPIRVDKFKVELITTGNDYLEVTTMDGIQTKYAGVSGPGEITPQADSTITWRSDIGLSPAQSNTDDQGLLKTGWKICDSGWSKTVTIAPRWIITSNVMEGFHGKAAGTGGDSTGKGIAARSTNEEWEYLNANSVASSIQECITLADKSGRFMAVTLTKAAGAAGECYGKLLGLPFSKCRLVTASQNDGVKWTCKSTNYDSAYLLI